ASEEGDVVCDPFMGVGSTGVAALEMRREFVGFEVDEAYFEKGRERIDGVKARMVVLDGKR
ncbi:DNA methyltransferase, partial [Calditrichota bacterium]